jgi:hypothetical protein
MTYALTFYRIRYATRYGYVPVRLMYLADLRYRFAGMYVRTIAGVWPCAS